MKQSQPLAMFASFWSSITTISIPFLSPPVPLSMPLLYRLLESLTATLILFEQRHLWWALCMVQSVMDVLPRWSLFIAIYNSMINQCIQMNKGKILCFYPTCMPYKIEKWLSWTKFYLLLVSHQETITYRAYFLISNMKRFKSPSSGPPPAKPRAPIDLPWSN